MRPASITPSAKASVSDTPERWGWPSHPHQQLYAITIALGLLGICLIGAAGLIHGRAIGAQILLRLAWQKQLVTGEAAAPWPGSDLRVQARLRVPRMDIAQIVLQGASAKSLAYGPGEKMLPEGPVGRPASRVIAGHRDTHFAFLHDLHLSDQILLEEPDGGWEIYHVQRREVRDHDDIGIAMAPHRPLLYLITCWPPVDEDGGMEPTDKRLVITARAEA